MTVKEIARLAHVSPPTVVRYCRTIGYNGLTDLKQRKNPSTHRDD
jgi:RpiR family carbohydrate utilization transcriptional regulator